MDRDVCEAVLGTASGGTGGWARGGGMKLNLCFWDLLAGNSSSTGESVSVIGFTKAYTRSSFSGRGGGRLGVVESAREIRPGERCKEDSIGIASDRNC